MTRDEPSAGPVLVHRTGSRIHALADNRMTVCGRPARELHGEAEGRGTCPTCTTGLDAVTCRRCRAHLARGGAR